MRTFDIIWGGSNGQPYFSTGLAQNLAQELVDDLDARGITYTTLETSDVAA